MFFSIFSSGDSFAVTTNSLATFVFITILGKFMSTKAMCLGTILLCLPNASEYVFSLCYRLKVIWINTVSHTTYVIKAEAFWNVSLMKFVRNSVNEFLFPVDFNKCVAARMQCAKPNPAAFGFEHLAKESDPIFFFHVDTQQDNLPRVNL